MSVTQEKNRVQDPRVAFFDHHAATWDDDAQEVAQTLARLESLRGRLGLRPGQDVLEAGCGTGRITGWLVQVVHPGRVVGVDFSPAMLARATARGLAAEFRLLDICAEATVREAFDVVFCFHAFPHFRDPLRALRSIHGLLKPGGELIVLHLIGSRELNAFHARQSDPVCHDRLPGPEAWMGMLANAGWRLLSLADEPDLFLLRAAA
ncbi:MAG TPA: methyltransferase domain-containing protein [Verrucomicrobiae bacterium]|nr:methyltransferase domain-containing protein [Verrucomicrobiae bacterium]